MPTVYVTAPRDVAPDLARFAVEERLAACANVVDCASTYRWEGEVTEGEAESILFVKTTAERYDELERRLRDEHPYDVPCIERFDEADAEASYADWIEAEVA